jgi:hypothetical protein
MKPCIIESPFAGDVQANKAYLQNCIRWCISHGWTPYASHQMLTDALDDLNPEQREQGMRAGIDMAKTLAFMNGAPWLFFVDRGFSGGMSAAHAAAVLMGRLTYAVSLTGEHKLMRLHRESTLLWQTVRPNSPQLAIFGNLWTPEDGWSDRSDLPAGWRP